MFAFLELLLVPITTAFKVVSTNAPFGIGLAS
jgi:hypothetical protein